MALYMVTEGFLGCTAFFEHSKEGLEQAIAFSKKRFALVRQRFPNELDYLCVYEVEPGQVSDQEGIMGPAEDFHTVYMIDEDDIKEEEEAESSPSHS